MIRVKATREELNFHIQRKRVSFTEIALVKMDSVVRRHILDGSIEIVEENNEIKNKKEKKVKDVK